MIVVDWLELMDHQLLLAINGAHSPFLDNAMWTISSRLFGIPFYLLFLFLLFKNKPAKQAFICVLLLFLVVGLSDLMAKYCFKEVFERFRPSHNLDLKEQLHFVLNANGVPYTIIKVETPIKLVPEKAKIDPVSGKEIDPQSGRLT